MSESTSALMSRWDAEDWEYDEETGGLVHLLRADDAVQAGLWKPGETAGRTIELELVAHETVLVLAGTGTLQVDGGPVIELGCRRHDLDAQGRPDDVGRRRRLQGILGLQRSGRLNVRRYTFPRAGGVAERTNAAVSKTVIRR